ncbi:MAG: hypothetical protein AB8C84_01460 [Oligoflexales bacterium]
MSVAFKKDESPSYVLRHDRFLEIGSDLKIRVGDKDYNLIDVSDFGCCFEGSVEDKESLSFQIMTPDSEEVVVQGQLECRWVDDQRTGCYFQEIEGGAGMVSAIASCWKIKPMIEIADHEYSNIPNTLKSLVYDIDHYLSVVKNQIQDYENSMMVLSEQKRQQSKRAIIQLIGPSFIKRMLDFSKSVDNIRDEIFEPSIKESCIRFFRHNLMKYLSDAPILKRSYEKPLGYAGDFEMMNQMYRHVPESSDTFGSLMHMYFNEEPACQSVRLRRGMFVHKFEEFAKKNPDKRLKVLSVGCGPAQEVAHFFETSDPEIVNRFEFVLMDQDVNALLDAKTRISNILLSKQLKAIVHYSQTGVRDLYNGTPPGPKDMKYDMVYSAGLYDYLNYGAARRLTQILTGHLTKNKSEMVVGNFSKECYSKTIGECLVDWVLELRSEEELLKVAPDDCPDAKIEKDEGGNQYFLCMKY